MEQDTIVGIASGMGGGIGIIRISGINALSLAGKVFRTKKIIDGDGPADSSWTGDFFKKRIYNASYRVL